MSSGKLFQSWPAATGKTRLPTVDSLTDIPIKLTSQKVMGDGWGRLVFRCAELWWKLPCQINKKNLPLFVKLGMTAVLKNAAQPLKKKPIVFAAGKLFFADMAFSCCIDVYNNVWWVWVRAANLSTTFLENYQYHSHDNYLLTKCKRAMCADSSIHTSM